jgi:hypothetical protein
MAVYLLNVVTIIFHWVFAQVFLAFSTRQAVLSLTRTIKNVAPVILSL